MSAPRTIMLAFTGASGMPYGLRLLECVLAADCRVWLAYSPAAQIVAKQECDLVLPTQPREATRSLAARYGSRDGQLAVFGCDDWNAPAASGSNPADAMVICPCTMGTLGAIAGGLADNLIARAADVMLKERRPLVLVPRETPLSAIHLENMLKLARAGAAIVPPVPGFYHRPQSIGDLVDFVVARVLDQIGVAHRLGPRWGEDRGGHDAPSGFRSA
jgi:4-hydroxy-3-polyprenylbenzoate decarboxylase